MTKPDISPKRAENRKLAIRLSLGTLLMFGFCYMLVPMYTLICKQTGINGKFFGEPAEGGIKSGPIDKSRVVVVQFVTTLHADLPPWKFKALTESISMHPGETKQVNFFAENDSGKDMTVQAIPSVTPGLAAQYLRKTECFCFTQQTLLKGQKVEMPVVFHIDPELPKDINMLTLSYTLYDATQYVKKDAPRRTTGRLLS